MIYKISLFLWYNICGRDSGWVKVYLGESFPEHNIRFISINDKLDSLKTKNYTDNLEFALLNLTYEYYAIDISNKVTTIKHMQQDRGDFIGVSAPYGYLKTLKIVINLLLMIMLLILLGGYLL